MKRREWRKIRAGQGLDDHHLSRQPLTTAVKNVSDAMVRVLRLLTGRENANGTSLRTWLVSAKQLEGLVKRGLVDVVWAKVPHRAPVDVKVDAVRISERGRALLAVWDILHPPQDVLFTGVHASARQWVLPPGATHGVLVGAGGGGGGGAGGSAGGQAAGHGGNGAHGHASISFGGHGGASPGAPGQPGTSVGGGRGGAGGAGAGMTAAQVAAAINQQVPGVVAAPVGELGVSIGVAAKGPAGTTKRISSAAEFRETFGTSGQNIGGGPGKRGP